MRSLLGVLVGSAVLVAGCGTQQEDRLAAPSEAPPSASPQRDPRIAVDGSRVTAVGNIQHVDGRVRLCSPRMITPTVLRVPPAPETPCGPGVWVEGVDAAKAATLRVTGTWRGDVLVAESQAAAEPEPDPADGPLEVPCEPPPGGWPRGGGPYDDHDATIRFEEAHPDLLAAGRMLVLRPAPDRPVVAVVVRDEAEKAAIEAELAPSVGVRKCVVVQDGDPDLALQVQHDPRFTQERLIMAAGTQWNPGLRTRSAYVSVVRVTELMVQAEADYPRGTLVLDPFLQVVDA